MGVWHLIVRYADDQVVVKVSGELDIATRPDLDSCVGGVLDAYRGPVVLDLSDVTFMDAHGLGGLVALKRRALSRLHLAGTPPPVQSILQLTGLEAVFQA